MTTDTETETTPRERIEEWAKARGVTMAAEFVAFSQSENAKPRPEMGGKPWRSLNWRVTILANGREVLTTPYSAGEGHCPASKASGATVAHWATRLELSDKAARQAVVEWECEHGLIGKVSWGFRGVAPAGGAGERSKPILPDLADVLYSLASAAGALDSRGFEDWAADYGYDADSRRAEASYRACLDIALKLRAAFGDEGLTALREAAQDF